MKYIILAVTIGVLQSCHGHAQTTSVVGTISAFKAQTAEIELKPDTGAPVSFKVTGDTMAQQVAPGVSDLKNAQTIRVTELHLGDRVLATPAPGTKDLRRIVVMSATDLARRDEADRADWTRRGVGGIVTAKSGDSMTLKMRGMAGDTETVVRVDANTKYRRYAPDSVRFADAKDSSLAEISIGAQVKARGQRTADGVAAQEVVFGTFTTRAGTITSVDAATRQITVKEVGGGKSMTIRVTADSQIKRMLDRQGMIAMMHGSAAAAGNADAEHRPAPPVLTLAEMMERLPLVKLEELQLNDIVIVSSTRGEKPDQVTAISMLANAEMLLQVAAMQAGGGQGPVSASSSLEMLSGMGFGVMQ